MTHVALLRGVNVGGNNLIPMAELAKLFASLGFPGARTLLQSGNAVFDGGKRSTVELERLLEAETEKRFGVRVDYFVRTAAQWKELVAANPLRREAKDDPARLIVMFLRATPTPESVKALQNALKGPEIVRASGEHAFVYYPAGQGKSKLTPALIERHLGRATGRNWNTVLKLLALTTG